MSNTPSFGITLAKLRSNAKLTQEQLAKNSGLHRTTISDIERDVLSPSLENIKRIAEALNVELYELFTPQSQKQSYKIHQPINGTLGEYFIAELESNQYKRAFITAAYAKISGISRIKSALKTFKSNGGEINCFIGIDQFNTTYEALAELLSLSDNLYVIHNESFSHTYHPKVYMLDNNTSNPNKVWLAIGSNNLTAGGLFINYESCNIDILDLRSTYDKKGYDDTLQLFKRFSDNTINLSLLINSNATLDKLFDNNYIKKERQVRITSFKSFSKSNKEILFGKESFKAPIGETCFTTEIKESTAKYHFDEIHNKTSIPDDLIPSMNVLQEIISDSSVEETFWFEMRKSTGGSRNILDLSSTAKLRSGSVYNTRYYNGNPDIIHGGIKFFDMNSNQHNATKDITISFNGNDYFPSTILYAPNNQSWRIQLKGESPTDTLALSEYGRSTFMNNILIFHKISSDYYVLEVMESSQLNNLISSSTFYATNGTPKTSKLFGKLK